MEIYLLGHANDMSAELGWLAPMSQMCKKSIEVTPSQNMSL